MKHRKTLKRVGAVIAFGVAAISGASQAPIRICPLGDSILESLDGQATARYYLDQLLNGDGYSFDFVGHNQGVFLGPPRYPNFDQDHECYSGWHVNHILHDLQMWVERSAGFGVFRLAPMSRLH